jgi:transcriptional regulator with XRE-family HTH domain
MTLSDYLIQKDLKDADFAGKCGVDRTTIMRIREGKTKPSHALMERIAIET